ncbi:hypothetical protein Pint_13719 [Pistacia integerrima]|uniref:Uncharacterized protein n=1 Tax=Pistacia integerrima TaxID=434235 RepID=A0ACC0Y9G7_9ROSI|nr:hypothetical protein Pint_13719 [Pistacia integerrima]
MPSRSPTLNNAFHTPDRRPLVAAITSLLQHLNPQNRNFKNFTSNSLNQFSHHLDSKLVLKVIQNQTNPFHALFFFNWASNPNPNPNNYTHSHLCYKAIIDTLLSHSLLSTATSLLQQSSKLSDFFIDGLKDNISTHNSILKGLCIVGKLEQAGTYLKHMTKSNVKPDVISYRVVINGYCKMGKSDEAISLLKEMQAGGIKPNVSSFNDVFRILVWMQEVEGLLDAMFRSGHNIDATMYSCLLKGYCEDGNLEAAMRIAYEMVSKKFVINLESISILFKELCAKMKFTEAETLFEMCVRCPVDDKDNYRRILDEQLCIMQGIRTEYGQNS